MMIRKVTAVMTAALLCIPFSACGKKTKISDITEPGTVVDRTAAKESDAILAVIDETWQIRFLGTYDDLLYPNAAITHINGNGDYTVSVDASGTGLSPRGLNIMYVKVFDGYELYPDMAIDIKSVRVDGKEIELKAKSYTTTEDRHEMRSNVYNTYVSKLPDDAHDASGKVTDFGTYAAQLIDVDEFADGWTKIEVDFSVTGIS